MSLEKTRPSLLERLRDPADQEAWRCFDSRYRELILRYAQKRGLQTADAEDVRQVVMLKLAGHMAAFRYQPELGRFRDYLGAMVRHAVSRHAQRRGLEVVGSDPAEASAGTVDAAWHGEWIHHHYRLAIGRVRESFSAGSCQVFDALLAGRAPAEIAADRGITTAAVYKVKQRFRDRMRVELQQQLREEEDGFAPGE